MHPFSCSVMFSIFPYSHMQFHCVFVAHSLYLFMYWEPFTLVPFPGYHSLCNNKHGHVGFLWSVDLETVPQCRPKSSWIMWYFYFCFLSHRHTDLLLSPSCPSPVDKGASAPNLHQHFLFFLFSVIGNVRWNLKVVFICASLVTGNVWHYFKHLLTVHVSSWVLSVQSISAFLDLMVCFFSV